MFERKTTLTDATALKFLVVLSLIGSQTKRSAPLANVGIIDFLFIQVVLKSGSCERKKRRN